MLSIGILGSDRALSQVGSSGVRRRRWHAHSDSPGAPGTHSPRDLSAPRLCARELVLWRRGRFPEAIAAFQQARELSAEASPHRRPARRSGTTAASGERGAARPANRLTRHRPPPWDARQAWRSQSTVSVGTLEEEKQWQTTSSSTEAKQGGVTLHAWNRSTGREKRRTSTLPGLPARQFPPWFRAVLRAE